MDPKRGYGLFDRNSRTCDTSVGRTDDGGAHFTGLVQIATLSCDSPRPATRLAFDDHGDGFAYGPNLYASHDDGRSWTATPTTHPVVAVDALGNSVWMAQAACPPPEGPGGCKLAVFVSDDGGRNWAGTATLDSPLAGGNTGMVTTANPTWLVRTGPTMGYALTPPRISLSGAANSAPLWHTTDSGRTWKASDIRCNMPAMSVAASAGPDGKLWAVCAAQPSAGHQVKTVQTSTDNAASWQLRSRCNPPSPTPTTACQGRPPDSGYLGAIVAVSPTTAFLVGARSALEVTHDGGATWAPVSSVAASTNGGTQEITFFDASRGLLLGDDDDANVAPALWSTDDGGFQWRVTLPKVNP